MKAKKAAKITFIAAALLAACFISFIASGLAGERNAVIRYDTIPSKSYDEYKEVCGAEIISQSGNTDMPFDLKDKLSDKKVQKEILSLISMETANPDSALCGEDGFYLSVCGAAMFDIASNRTNGSVQCFIFTKDLEEAGTVRFNGNGKNISVSVNNTAADTRSAILKKLEEDKNGKFVVLLNGIDTVLLDEENNVTNAGSSRHKLETDGDCYGALKDLSISYSEITDSENLIWFSVERPAAEVPPM